MLIPCQTDTSGYTISGIFDIMNINKLLIIDLLFFIYFI